MKVLAIAVQATGKNQDTKPRKGEVRQEILNLLSKQPYTVTEIANILGISKPTVAYHLSYLSSKGLTSVNRIEVDKRGFERKYHSLDRPLQFMLSSRIEEKYLQLISDIFNDVKAHLAKNDLESEKVGQLLKGALYHVFRMLPNITSIRHDENLAEHGRKIGIELSRRIRGTRFREVISNIRAFWELDEIGRMEPPWINRNKAIMAVHDCLGCDISSSCKIRPEANTPLCHFTTGMVNGMLEAKLGKGYRILETEFQKTGSPFCKHHVGFQDLKAT